MQRKFSITMRAPLGLRFGTICFDIQGDALTGTLNILRCSNAFVGQISQTGDITFTGDIVTRIRTFPYSAKGLIDGHSLSLDISGNRGCLHVSGEEIDL